MLIIFFLSFISSVVTNNVAGPAVFNGEEWLSVAEGLSIGNTMRPPDPFISSVKESTSEIFVGLLHFRDPRCGATLHDLFAKAEFPERVRIGLVQQRSQSDADCIAEYCRQHGVKDPHLYSEKCPYISQITAVQTSQIEPKSFSRGRRLVSHLLKDEEFCMSIESNVEFIQHWDTEMLSMWKATGNEYGILSTHPPISLSSINDVVRYSENNQHEVPHMCQANYYTDVSPVRELIYTSETTVVENLAARRAVNLVKPLLAPLYTSTFSFSKCHAERKVIIDV